MAAPLATARAKQRQMIQNLFVVMVPLVLAVPTAVGVIRYAEKMEKLMPYLGLNVLLNVITPLLLAIGLLIAG